MATLEQLKVEATELGLEYPAKIIKADLEALIAEAQTPENVESIEDTITDAENEAPEVTKENEQPEDEAPKLNKDGFEAGKPLSDEDFAKYMAKARK